MQDSDENQRWIVPSLIKYKISMEYRKKLKFIIINALAMDLQYISNEIWQGIAFITIFLGNSKSSLPSF